jgi:2-polyprenyl-3-methyl-5-hydroxy-6-metoxy-1,4-benzoquinol methylase
MTTNASCLACRGSSLRDLVEGRILQGSTTKADALHAFQLLQCQDCGHVQKALNADWHAAMDGLYERHYEDYRVVGRQVNFVEGKIVNRDGLAVRKLDALLALGESGAVLDIGCGAGRFLEAFRAEKPGWSLAGYDVGDLHENSVHTLSGAEFFHGADALHDIPRKFDLVTLNHVVEHLTDPVSVLRDAADLLTPDGRLLIRVPSFQAVNTDFFLLEHCSHFTVETLSHTLNLAGLEVIREISDFSPIEIGLVARRAQNTVASAPYDIHGIRKSVHQCLAWAESLPSLVRDNIRGRKAGLLGVGGAGIWLGVYLRGEISFYVDEDPGKQGHSFAGCPIIKGSEVSPDAIVFVTFNNAQASERICARLSEAFPDKSFLAPPVVLYAET